MSRADLHCHSAASEVSKLGVQRELGLPECATPPRALGLPVAGSYHTELTAYAALRSGDALIAAGLAGRSWEASLARLAAGWHHALAVTDRSAPVAVAPPA